MSTGSQARTGSAEPADVVGAVDLLRGLCIPFAGPDFRPDCTVVHPDAIPHPEDDLLVHHDHMTVVLQKHHGEPVDVQVMQESREPATYTRQISLFPKGSEKVVEWGIARLTLRHIPDAPRQEILDRQKPLGAILIAHNVHRRVKPLYFLRFAPDSNVLKLFGDQFHAQPIYGRLGLIYCDGEPAIELLEMVLNTRTDA